MRREVDRAAQEMRPLACPVSVGVNTVCPHERSKAATLQITARARLGMGLADSSLQGAYPSRSQGAGQGAFASPWRLPALHFPLSRERKTGQGNPRPLRTGGGALANPLVHHVTAA